MIQRPGRRYEPANGDVSAVRRYLSGEAVQAHAPSRVYRMRKIVRRHKGQVHAATVIALTGIDIKGYDGLQHREKNIPENSKVRTTQALDRLIELYTATNKPDEVTKYQERRAKYPVATMVEKK